MKFLDRIWSDVQRGENIEMYITIVLALVLAVFNVVGIASSSWIAPLTLVVLSALALSNIKIQHDFDLLFKKLSRSASSFFLEKFPESINSDIEEATELWLVGVTLTYTISQQYLRIEHLLQEGSNVKVLLVHPEGPALEMAEDRAYLQSSPERRRNVIHGSVEDFCTLRSIAPDKLEIRTIRNPMSHGIIAVNPDLVSGVFYIANYPFKVGGGSRPKFILRASDGHWYDFYKKELLMLWNNGIEWHCKESN